MGSVLPVSWSFPGTIAKIGIDAIVVQVNNMPRGPSQKIAAVRDIFALVTA